MAQKYYIDHIYYTRSELRKADKFLLRILEPYCRMVVSGRWIDGLCRYLIGRLEDFRKEYPQTKPVAVEADFRELECDRHSYKPDPAIRAGKLTVHLAPVVADLDLFEIPMFENQPETK